MDRVIGYYDMVQVRLNGKLLIKYYNIIERLYCIHLSHITLGITLLNRSKTRCTATVRPDYHDRDNILNSID